ncbi:polysaccharide lyase 8 family protein [Arthrobacter sp. lap29]|uniref:polysaccharide lyase 8 family protein n=1 Tax=Arthrobacter sp. lap29 TaxID=3056122 RepID=UPI0028F74A96|nr:polysaccharide lyase 8 family protein [Arthrobacter sp. lap29]
MTHGLTRRHILQGAGALTFAGLLTGGFAPLAQAAETATAPELDALRERWVDQITGRKLITAGDPEFATALVRLDTEVTSSISKLLPGGNRVQIFSDAAFSADTHMVTTYKRLAQMATAWATPGSAHEGNAELLHHLLAALEDGNRLIYNTSQPEFGNWWNWEIGVPRPLGDALAILGSHVPVELLGRYMAAVDHFIPDPTKQFSAERGPILSQGANRVDICQGSIIRAIVGHDPARLAQAINALSPVWQYVTSGNGFFDDGSFVQHSTIAYTGTYGLVLLSGLSKLFSLLSESEHAVSDPSRDILFKTVEDSFAPFIHNGQMMDSVRGRAISRTQERSYDNGDMAIEAILWLARAVDPATAKRWRRLCQGWISRNTFEHPMTGASIPRTALLKDLAAAHVSPLAENSGHSFFAGMDRSVYRGSGWALSLGLCSNRIAWYECGNGENDLGAQTGSGMTYLYTGKADHFDDNFWPTANLVKLPGTTVDTTPLPPRVEGQWGERTPGNDWTGGVSLGTSGAVGMHLLAPGGTGMQARKAWFYAPDMVVALGAGIHSPSEARVETVVEHRNLGPAGGQKITLDGRRVASAAGSPSIHKNPKWAHVEGTGGYLLLGSTALTVLREQRTGAWKNINSGGPADIIQREYATLLIDHGKQPKKASYAYALLPGATAKTTEKAARKAPRILRNDTVGQGVALGHKESAAVFWQAGWVGNIFANGPACVLYSGNPGHGRLAVADPTHAAEYLAITLKGTKYRRVTGGTGATLSRDAAGNTVVTVRVATLLGRTVELSLQR